VNCEPLAVTGLSSNIFLLVGVAAVCLVAGAIALFLSRSPGRKGGRTTAALLVVLIGGIVLSVGPVPAVHAASTDCNAADNTLSVTQTSTMDAIAPGVAPRPITGVVVNEGNDSTHIAAVDVAITAVTTSLDAPLGVCDASDFTLSDPLMPVGRTLAPGASTTFSGAAIGFANKSINQDACKNAVVHLLYTANPVQ
jgi:hypothetical protein